MKTITLKDYEKIVKQAEAEAEKIPASHNRKKEEIYHRTIINGINKARSRKDGKANKFVQIYSYNQGTRKWSNYISKTCENVIRGTEKETEKTFAGVRKNNILCFIK